MRVLPAGISPGSILKPSRFNVSIALGHGSQAVFNTLSGAFSVLDAEIFLRFLKPGTVVHVLPDGEIDTLPLLLGHGFLVDASLDEGDLLAVTIESKRHAENCVGFTIAPTLKCNLQCRYCYGGESQQHAVQESMSSEMERAIIKYVVKASRGKDLLDICWYGGEPLLSSETIFRISSLLIPACDKAGMSYRASLLTNGVLLVPSLAARLRDCRIDEVQLTIDVPFSAKRDREGRDTLDTVLDNLSSAVESLSVELRVNLSEDREEQFDELYQKLRARDLMGRLRSFCLAGVDTPESGRTGHAFRPMERWAFSRAKVREIRKAHSVGLPVRILPRANSLECPATRIRSSVIAPDGTLYKCYQDIGLTERAFASVLTETPVPSGNLLPWLAYRRADRKPCRQCAVAPLCGGGCPHDRLFKTNARDPEACRCLRKTTEALVGMYASLYPNGQDAVELSESHIPPISDLQQET